MKFKNLFILILIIIDVKKNPSLSEEETEPIITFEKSIENIKSTVRQTKDEGYIIAGGQGGQAWLLKLNKYGD